MRKILLLVALSLVWTGSISAATGDNVFPASSSNIRWVGRVMDNEDGSVSFNWSGTYMLFSFNGNSARMVASDTGKNYFDVFADGIFYKTISTRASDSTIVLFQGAESRHSIMVRRRTEGSIGITKVSSLILSNGGELLSPVQPKERYIEVVGDSYTCGYGTESDSGADPFTAETENCGKAYGCIVAEYFDADYNLICHSGRGVVRNYGDPSKVSANGTMEQMYNFALDDVPSSKGMARKASRKPDIVIMYLGENDFSTGITPSKKAFIENYRSIIHQVRSAHGDVPVICLVPPNSGTLTSFVEEAVSTEGENVYLNVQYRGIYNRTTDLGASEHPNRYGQKKIASNLIPYISTITGWPLK